MLLISPDVGDDPSVKFLEFEGFYQVVVSTGHQTADALFGRAQGADDEDRGLIPLGADRAEQLKTRLSGEHQIEDNGIGSLRADLFQAIFDIGDNHHLHVLIAEPFADRIGERWIVFNQ